MKTVRACVASALLAALLAGCGASPNGANPVRETSVTDTTVLDVWYQSDNPSSAFNSKMEEAVS